MIQLFQDSLKKFKEQHLFEIECLCNNADDFNVTLDHFNASLLLKDKSSVY